MKSQGLVKIIILCAFTTLFNVHAQELITIKQIGVFCSSTDKLNNDYIQAAKDLGTLCAFHNIKILFGGANSGLMGALADAALSAGGYLRGILPESGRIWNVDHKGVQEMVYTSDIYDRFKEFDKADAFVILPGGIGTLSEAAHVIAQKQYGIHKKPIIFININGFFDNLLTFFKCMVNQNTAKEQHLKLFDVVTCPEDIILALNKQPDGFLDHEWWRQ